MTTHPLKHLTDIAQNAAMVSTFSTVTPFLYPSGHCHNCHFTDKNCSKCLFPGDCSGCIKGFFLNQSNVPFPFKPTDPSSARVLALRREKLLGVQRDDVHLVRRQRVPLRGHADLHALQRPELQGLQEQERVHAVPGRRARQDLVPAEPGRLEVLRGEPDLLPDPANFQRQA
jgi:hypothetical protein